MLEIPEGVEHRDSHTVLRFYDDEEEVAELVDSGVPAPSEGDKVNLHEIQQLEGPGNPDVIHPENEDSEWGGQGLHREVDKAVYQIKRMEFPNQFGTAVCQHVTVVEVYLSNPHK